MSREVLLVPSAVGLLTTLAFLSGCGKPRPTQPAVLDDFERDPTRSCAYLPGFRGPQLGYGVFYDAAVVEVTRTVVTEADQALRVRYELPALCDGGDWLSIRCEFDSLMDLSGYTALKFDLKVETLAEAKLRMTLADAVSASQRNSDELWWFDLTTDALGDSSGQWRTMTVPLREFYLSHGTGTRHNDGRFDRSKITAYEINVISENGKHPRGIFLVNSLAAPLDSE